nr:hypothetical protein [Mycoplasmopsis bovis]
MKAILKSASYYKMTLIAWPADKISLSLLIHFGWSALIFICLATTAYIIGQMSIADPIWSPPALFIESKAIVLALLN